MTATVADPAYRAHLDLVERAAATGDPSGPPASAVVAALGEARLLAPMVGQDHGGLGWDHRRLGSWCAALGARSTGIRAMVTVQSMVAAAVSRWGTEALRARILPELAGGTLTAAFCLTEPAVGSDAAAVHTTAEPHGGGWRISGRKLWVTAGASANLLLVLASAPAGPLAALVDTRTAAGHRIRRSPVSDALAMRDAGLADLTFDGVEVPADTLGPPGVGFSHVAQVALAQGRFTVAAGCAGMAEACLADMVRWARERRQYGRPIGEHQLVRRLIAKSAVAARSARLLFEWAAAGLDSRSADAVERTFIAKYAAANAAAEAADHALQVYGAAGFRGGGRVARFARDARAMRVIEGTDEICESTIGGLLLAGTEVAG